jgi:hypothetical protein
MDRALAGMSLDSQPALDTTECQKSKREMKRRSQQAEHDHKAAQKKKEDVALDEGNDKIDRDSDDSGM